MCPLLTFNSSQEPSSKQIDLIFTLLQIESTCCKQHSVMNWLRTNFWISKLFTTDRFCLLNESGMFVYNNTIITTHNLFINYTVIDIKIEKIIIIENWRSLVLLRIKQISSRLSYKNVSRSNDLQMYYINCR